MFPGSQQQSGFGAILDAIKRYNEERKRKNAAMDQVGYGRDIDYISAIRRGSVGPLNQNQLTDASAAGIPWDPTHLQASQMIDTRGFPKKREVSPLAPPPTSTPHTPAVSQTNPSNVSATGPGSSPSTMPVSYKPTPSFAPPPSPQTDIYDELGPEGIDSVLGMGDLNRQMQYASAMRQQAAPEGRYLSGGRMYVASSPLEHLAVGYGRLKGKRDEERLSGELQKGRKSIIDLLRQPRSGGLSRSYDPLDGRVSI